MKGSGQAEVTENMRQRNSPTLREAVEHLAMGRPAEALKVLDPHITRGWAAVQGQGR